MRSRFLPPSWDSGDPDVPGPAPFPIKIVNDLPPDDDKPPEPAVPKGYRDDSFYPAWDRFLALEPKRAKHVSSAARQVAEEKRDIAAGPEDGLKVLENAAKSLEEATAECKTKVEAIVKECKRLNQKYRDAVFDLEANPYCVMSLSGESPEALDYIGGPPWIKRVEDIFDEPQFFIDGASATDVHQGCGGDCWFLAALMAISAKKELIDKVCVARDPEVGVYGFVFYRDGEWIHEVIDDKLYLKVGDDDDLAVVRDWDREGKKGLGLRFEQDKLKEGMQRGGEALYFSHCKSSETWLPLIEKAFAKSHGDYCAIEGGYASEGIEDLTGGVGVVINPEDIMNKERFWREQLSKVNDKYLFGGGSRRLDVKGVVGGHAYAVMQAWEEGDLKLLKVRNPWGRKEWEGDWSDGSKLWTPELMTKLQHTFGDDGVFWITYKDFLKHFPSINRVRLFSAEWQVAQQWTAAQIPWTVDYLDTKFQFSISEKTSVVVVLSQPDDRYYQGLCGRYMYSLHFRVYKEGHEDEWLVRSMHNSGNDTLYTRSVSAELEDLDPGTYNVIFKVTPTRYVERPTAGEAIKRFAVERKEKLLHVGRRYDYAHAKGNRRAMEENVKKQNKLDLKMKQKKNLKNERKVNKQENARGRLRKKRIDDALREKRRQLEMERKEKIQKKMAQKADGGETESTDVQASAGDRVTPASSSEIAKSQIGSEETTADPPAEQSSKVEKSAMQSEGQSAAESKSQQVAHDDAAKDEKTDAGEQLSKGLSGLQIDAEQQAMPHSDHPDVSPISPVQGDDVYESPVEALEELDDDDFDWDSEIDGPVDFDSSGDEMDDGNDAIFGDDPWNALCVLGLRVYSLNSRAKITVLNDEAEP